MYYGSRWYDPELGRFAQPDSIIPNAADSQAFDRYSYVENSPVDFNDPSGHTRACHDEYEAGMTINVCTEWADPGPTPDPGGLDDVHGKTGISGRDFYNWYLSLWNNKSGWWWNMFGNDSDGFTIFDAFAVVYTSETKGDWTNASIPEAAIRELNYRCGGSCSTAGYINAFAHKYQSAGNLVRGGVPGDITDPASSNYDSRFGTAQTKAMQNLAQSFTNHDTAWNSGCAWAAPCGWDNKSMHTNAQWNVLMANQSAAFEIYGINGADPWVIPSGCVVTSWWGQGNDKNYNLNASCPAVR